MKTQAITKSTEDNNQDHKIFKFKKAFCCDKFPPKLVKCVVKVIDSHVCNILNHSI